MRKFKIITEEVYEFHPEAVTSKVYAEHQLKNLPTDDAELLKHGILHVGSSVKVVEDNTI